MTRRIDQKSKEKQHFSIGARLLVEANQLVEITIFKTTKAQETKSRT
jgi:hypothetical protein